MLMCNVEEGMPEVIKRKIKETNKKRVAYDAKASTKDIGNQRKQPDLLCAGGSIKSHTPSDRIIGSPRYGKGGEKANVVGIHKEQGRIAFKRISYRGKTRDGS